MIPNKKYLEHLRCDFKPSSTWAGSALAEAAQWMPMIASKSINGELMQRLALPVQLAEGPDWSTYPLCSNCSWPVEDVEV